MFDIRPMNDFNRTRFREIASGYSTTEIYRVNHVETGSHMLFELRLESLSEPWEFRFPFSDEELQRYRAIVPGPYCLGAFDGSVQVGIALAEAQAWNQTLWVWEFHVHENYRGRGAGRILMAELAQMAKDEALRAIVCETQNTNVPAIRFYRAVGFRLEGVDISYYTNEDMEPGRTVAVFMKYRLK